MKLRDPLAAKNFLRINGGVDTRAFREDIEFTSGSDFLPIELNVDESNKVRIVQFAVSMAAKLSCVLLELILFRVNAHCKRRLKSQESKSLRSHFRYVMAIHSPEGLHIRSDCETRTIYQGEVMWVNGMYEAEMAGIGNTDGIYAIFVLHNGDWIENNG